MAKFELKTLDGGKLLGAQVGVLANFMLNRFEEKSRKSPAIRELVVDVGKSRVSFGFLIE
jgi:hypothetical protein